jgi:von Willebrand factor type A domain
MYDMYFSQIKNDLKLRLLPPNQVFIVVVTDGLQNQGAYSPIDAVNAIKRDFATSKPTVDTTLTFVAVGVNQVNEQTLLQIADGDADKIHFVSDFDGLSTEFADKVLTSITEPCAKNVTISFLTDPDGTVVTDSTRTSGFSSNDTAALTDGNNFTINIKSLDTTTRYLNYTLDVCGCSKALLSPYTTFKNYNYKGVPVNSSPSPVAPQSSTFNVTVEQSCVAATLTKTLASTSWSSQTSRALVAGQDTMTFNLTVQNTGVLAFQVRTGTTTTGYVMVSDAGTVVSCPTTTVVSGASVVCTAVYTITAADVTLGTKTNKACISGTNVASTKLNITEACSTVTPTVPQYSR